MCWNNYDMKEEIKNSYCLKCGKNTKSKNLKVARAKNGRIMLLSRCAVCNRKKSKFLEETRSLLWNLLDIKVPILSDIPIVNTLF